MSTADLTRMHLATQNPEGGLEAAIESGGRASEAPTVTESTPAKLSDPVPQSVYRNAEDGKQVHMSGKSGRTLRRQKKTLRDLQAQGFQTLPNFFKRKAEERDEMDKFKAMVARVKAKLRALQGAEEEEAGTESEMGDEDEDTFEPSSTTCRIEQEHVEKEHTISIHSDLHSDTCQEPSWSILEEEEEELDDDQVPDKRNKSANDSAMEEQSNREDAQDTLLWMLKDLHYGNDPEDGSHQHSADSAVDTLQDRAALRTAQEELVCMVKEKKSGNFVHTRILAMEATLNIFLDEELGFTWTKASIVMAKSHGRGRTCARMI
jgi:hypothetical protein